jgi:hypothetical protein
MGYDRATQGGASNQRVYDLDALCIAADVDVKEVTHIAGEDNKQCDRSSRRWDIGKVPTMTVAEEAEDMGLRGVDVLEMDVDSGVRGVVELCDPRTELSTENQFISFWMRARSAIDTFMSMHNRTQSYVPDNSEGPPQPFSSSSPIFLDIPTIVQSTKDGSARPS